eukprot:2355507-Rhodomonas_salina.4
MSWRYPGPSNGRTLSRYRTSWRRKLIGRYLHTQSQYRTWRRKLIGRYLHTQSQYRTWRRKFIGRYLQSTGYSVGSAWGDT